MKEAEVILREYHNENIDPEIIQISEKFGHYLIFTPPHYNDIHPIELLWARIKSSIAKKYSKCANITDVRM